ncbi:MAG: hypothetical protein KatS3mg115_2327 [Candidatus Poribacteria bacterium]|nr:MAG: hypothetical protein KatS3mg115_2327 [Candidatus Poribacteria bacterium]
MGRTLWDEALESCLSRLPEETVQHWAAAQRELLFGFRALVDRWVEEAAQRVEETARRAQERRERRRERSEERGHRVTIEEEDEPAH